MSLFSTKIKILESEKKKIFFSSGNQMQERRNSRFCARRKHQVLPRLLGRELEEEVEGAKRVLFCVDATEVASTGTPEEPFYKYYQTCVNDHLRITTTCLLWPSFWSPNYRFYNINLPLNNNHLSTTATNFGSRGWSLYAGLTV